MRVHPSALTHGVQESDVGQAAERPVWIEPLDDDDPSRREPRLGFDTGARLLDAVVLTLQDGAQLVVCARP